MRILALATFFSLTATSAMAQLATPILGADQANAIQGQMTEGSGMMTDAPLQVSPDAAPASRDVVKRANETVEKRAARKAAIAQGQAAPGPAAGVQQPQDNDPAVKLPPPPMNPEMMILLQLQAAQPANAEGEILR